MALTRDVLRNYEQGNKQQYPVAAGAIIWEGAAVGMHASTGLARPLVAGDRFLGFAETTADNADGAAGAHTVHVFDQGKIELAVSGVAVADVGAAIYASDDDTFTATASGNSFVGTVARYISRDLALVAFDATLDPTQFAPPDVVLSVNGQTGAVSVDKASVGLGNVDNTSDADKPVSMAVQAALNAKADLDGSGKIPNSQLSALAITDTFVINSQAAMLALAAHVGDVAIRTDLRKSFILQGSDPSVLADWQELLVPPNTVTSVAGKQGVVVLTPADVGLARTTASVTTASLGSNATENTTVELAKSFILQRVTCSCKARVRLYKTAASRTADAGRSHTTQPEEGTPHGVICDFYLDGSTGAPLDFMCSRDVMGSNADTPAAATVYAAATNLESTAHAVTVAFGFVPLEN